MSDSQSQNGAVVKTVAMHTVSYLVTGLLATAIASKVAVAVIDVRLTHMETGLYSMSKSLEQMVVLQTTSARGEERIRSIEKTLDAMLIVQRSLLDDTRDRYTGKQAEEAHSAIRTRMNSLHGG